MRGEQHGQPGVPDGADGLPASLLAHMRGEAAREGEDQWTLASKFFVSSFLKGLAPSDVAAAMPAFLQFALQQQLHQEQQPSSSSSSPRASARQESELAALLVALLMMDKLTVSGLAMAFDSIDPHPHNGLLLDRVKTAVVVLVRLGSLRLADLANEAMHLFTPKAASRPAPSDKVGPIPSTTPAAEEAPATDIPAAALLLLEEEEDTKLSASLPPALPKPQQQEENQPLMAGTESALDSSSTGNALDLSTSTPKGLEKEAEPVGKDTVDQAVKEAIVPEEDGQDRAASDLLAPPRPSTRPVPSVKEATATDDAPPEEEDTKAPAAASPSPLLKEQDDNQHMMAGNESAADPSSSPADALDLSTSGLMAVETEAEPVDTEDQAAKEAIVPEDGKHSVPSLEQQQQVALLEQGEQQQEAGGDDVASAKEAIVLEGGKGSEAASEQQLTAALAEAAELQEDEEEEEDSAAARAEAKKQKERDRRNWKKSTRNPKNAGRGNQHRSRDNRKARREEGLRQAAQQQLEVEKAVVLQRWARRLLARRVEAELQHQCRVQRAAVKLQGWRRGQIARRAFTELLHQQRQQRAATRLQAGFRRWLAAKTMSAMRRQRAGEDAEAVGTMVAALDTQVAEAPHTLLRGSPVLPVSSLVAMVLRHSSSDVDGGLQAMAAPQARRILPAFLAQAVAGLTDTNPTASLYSWQLLAFHLLRLCVVHRHVTMAELGHAINSVLASDRQAHLRLRHHLLAVLKAMPNAYFNDYHQAAALFARSPTDELLSGGDHAVLPDEEVLLLAHDSDAARRRRKQQRIELAHQNPSSSSPSEQQQQPEEQQEVDTTGMPTAEDHTNSTASRSKSSKKKAKKRQRHAEEKRTARGQQQQQQQADGDDDVAAALLLFPAMEPNDFPHHHAPAALPPSSSSSPQQQQEAPLLHNEEAADDVAAALLLFPAMEPIDFPYHHATAPLPPSSSSSSPHPQQQQQQQEAADLRQEQEQEGDDCSAASWEPHLSLVVAASFADHDGPHGEHVDQHQDDGDDEEEEDDGDILQRLPEPDGFSPSDETEVSEARSRLARLRSRATRREKRAEVEINRYREQVARELEEMGCEGFEPGEAVETQASIAEWERLGEMERLCLLNNNTIEHWRELGDAYRARLAKLEGQWVEGRGVLVMLCSFLLRAEDRVVRSLGAADRKLDAHAAIFKAGCAHLPRAYRDLGTTPEALPAVLEADVHVRWQRQETNAETAVTTQEFERVVEAYNSISTPSDRLQVDMDFLRAVQDEFESDEEFDLVDQLIGLVCNGGLEAPDDFAAIQKQTPLALLLHLQECEAKRQDRRQKVMEAASEVEQASGAEEREAKLVEAERRRIDHLYKGQVGVLEIELAGLQASLAQGFGRWVWLKAVLAGLEVDLHLIEDPVLYRALELPFGTVGEDAISGALRAATLTHKLPAMCRLAEEVARERGWALTADETAAVRKEGSRRCIHATACANVLRDPLQRVAFEASYFMQMENLPGFWN